MTTNGIVSRADLLAALAAAKELGVSDGFAAKTTGYTLVGKPETEAVDDTLIDVYDQYSDASSFLLDSAANDGSSDPPSRTGRKIWRVVGYKRIQPVPQKKRSVSRPVLFCDPKSDAPALSPLAPTGRLLARLRRGWNQHSHAGIDTAALIDRVSRALTLHDLPRRRRRRWGQHLQIVVDRHEHMTPFWADQNHVVSTLMPLFPSGTVGLHVVSEINDQLFRTHQFLERVNGGNVLVLGDLGVLDLHHPGAAKRWHHFGRKTRSAGGSPIVLTPSCLGDFPAQMRADWQIVPWETDTLQFGDGSDRIEDLEAVRLLQVLLSPAIRIEPGLLRRVRRSLPGNRRAALETFFWQQPELASTHSAGAVWRSSAIKELRLEFEREFHPAADCLKRMVLAAIRSWREHLDPVIWAEELLGLNKKTVEHMRWQQPWSDALQYLRSLPRDDQLFGQDGAPVDWIARFTNRIPEDLLAQEHPVSSAVAQLWSRRIAFRPDEDPPTGLSHLELIESKLPPRTLHVCETGAGDITVRAIGNENVARNVVANLCTRNGLLNAVAGEIYTSSNVDQPADFWVGERPEFAERWGWDEYGAWFEFDVAVDSKIAVRAEEFGFTEGGFRDSPIVQRMRWISPGKFLMGSPKSDDLADKNEFPQHEVTISNGFWMMDTPVTQAIWAAIGGENPSSFKGIGRPVERVNWDDAVGFGKRLGGEHSFGLPTEAQWEYACRARTTTPYNTGETITRDQARFYSSDGPNDGTQPVAQFAPNAFGLFDMHGLVWEWCSDSRRGYSEESVTDPVGNQPNVTAVVRGGSWLSVARDVRSACRFVNRREFRYIGFRCVWVRQGAEPQERRGSDRAGEGAPQAQGGGAVSIRVANLSREISVEERQDRLTLSSDSESIQLERRKKPKWASSFGRDRYGVWASVDFSLPMFDWDGWSFRKKDRQFVVDQKLRWIPPGDFLMGSPEDEEGRDENEGPQHEVTINQGFWMFDTACTQELWTLVNRDNPSHFPHRKRPVEQVSWDETVRFCDQLSELNPDLRFTLPTEAQWEYACRAGTQSAIYSGDLEILGDANAPALHDIAVYGGNSGVDFELPDGIDLTHRRDRQFEVDPCGTHPVAQKAPNPWGLYDMLGNVWEWCADGRRSYTDTAETNPVGSTESDAPVVRGGGWYSSARVVRSACRSGSRRVDRVNSIGFRCVCSGETGPSGVSAADATRDEEQGQQRRTK